METDWVVVGPVLAPLSVAQTHEVVHLSVVRLGVAASDREESAHHVQIAHQAVVLVGCLANRRIDDFGLIQEVPILFGDCSAKLLALLDQFVVLVLVSTAVLCK